MLQRFTSLFTRLAGLKTFLLALGIYLVFGAYIMPNGAKAITTKSGFAPASGTVKILDLQFTGYTPVQARQILSAYTVEARHYAAWFTLVADSLYPWAYTFIYLIVLAWIYKNLPGGGRSLRYILLLPLITMVLDYCENACTVLMMHQYPRFSDTLVHTASFFTCMKWAGAGLQTMLVAGGIVWLLVHKVRAKHG